MIRIVLVGYGRMAQGSHRPTIESTAHSSLVGVVRRTQSPELSVPQFSNLSAALAQLHPDLAIISTPHALHYQQALECIQAGCHVLVDKPLTLSLEDSRRLVDAAQERDRLLVVGLQRRYEGLAKVFSRLTEDGTLGAPTLIHGLFAHRFADKQPEWFSDESVAGAGIVDDSGWHIVDLLLYFANSKVVDLQANVLREVPSLPHSFSLIAKCASGASIAATASYLSPSDSVQEEISIFGTNGSLFARRFCLDWNANPPVVSFKSFDGKHKEDADMTQYAGGRRLPLQKLLDYLNGQVERSEIRSEASSVLETQRVTDLLRKAR